MKIDGQCHCGDIRFSAEIDPKDVFICHCTDCQHFSGAPYRASVRASAETVVFEGEPKTYLKTAESGAKRAQGFCPNCGTSLFSSSPTNTTFYMLRLGAVNQKRDLKPTLQSWRRSAQSWSADLHDIASSDQQAYTV